MEICAHDRLCLLPLSLQSSQQLAFDYEFDGPILPHKHKFIL